MSRWTMLPERMESLGLLVRAARGEVDHIGPEGDLFFPPVGGTLLYRMANPVDGPGLDHPWVVKAAAADGTPCLAGPVTLGVLATLWTKSSGLAHTCKCGGEILVLGILKDEARGICSSCGTLARRSLSTSRFDMHVRKPLAEAGREPVPRPATLESPSWMDPRHDKSLHWNPLVDWLSTRGVSTLPSDPGLPATFFWPRDAWFEWARANKSTYLARYVRGCLKHRDALLARDPWIPLPFGLKMQFGFGARGASMPIGALFLFWDDERMVGRCICGGRTYPYAFGGMMSFGCNSICAECGKTNRGWGGGMQRFRELTDGTPYFVSGRASNYPPSERPLWQALKDLGETDLPPESRIEEWPEAPVRESQKPRRGEPVEKGEQPGPGSESIEPGDDHAGD